MRAEGEGFGELRNRSPVDKVNQRNEVELCEPVCDTANPLANASNQECESQTRFFIVPFLVQRIALYNLYQAKVLNDF